MAEQTYDLVDLDDLILKRTRTVNVPLGKGLGITVEWLPDAMTKTVYAQLKAARAQARADEDPFLAAEAYIVPLVKKWSLTTGGEPLPITVETVGNLGLIIVRLMGEAIDNDFAAALNPEEMADLKGGSGGT